MLSRVLTMLHYHLIMKFGFHYEEGIREITRLDLMAYLEPPSNPGSKPQKFSVKYCKSSTSDKFQTFKKHFWHFL